MPATLPDIYISSANGIWALQGASQAAIDFLIGQYSLSNGTTALVTPEELEEAFGRIDAAGLMTMTLG